MAMDYMNFGKLRKAYDSGRHDYPQEVMDCILSLAGASSKVLDVGCGTGIATRQLAQKVADHRRAGVAGGAQGKRMAFGKTTLAAQRGHHRYLRQLQTYVPLPPDHHCHHQTPLSP